MSDRKWTDVRAQAEHYIAIDSTDVFLGSSFDGLDWEDCVSIEWEDASRSFAVTFASNGITGRWYFDIIDRRDGSERPDMAGIYRLIAAVPDRLLPAVQHGLIDYALGLEHRAGILRGSAAGLDGQATAVTIAARGHYR